MASAFGIVYSSVAGNHQVTRDASRMKRLQPGLAAQAAVVAVQLARRGIRGPQGVFEGIDGFFRVYLHGRASADDVRADLGTRFELMNLSYKPYPCCRDTHAAVDAVLELRRLTQRPSDDIESIRVGLTSPGYQMVCVPEAVRLAPRTIVEAQFSIPYAVAAAWIDGGLGISHFTDDALRRPDVLALASRVQPFVDDEFDRDWRRVITPAKVSVHFRDGQTVQARVDYSKGHPRNPMTPREFAAKTRDCAAVAMRPLSAEAVDRFTSTISELESIRDVATLVQTLVPVANSVP
jgi:2-methylcitrate dehydratase PrpD